MLQVFSIEAERLVVHLSQALVPQLGLLQVRQEVGVDGAALDEAHAAAHWTSLSQRTVVLHAQEKHGSLEPHWILKWRRRTAKLSHAPSMANLLAQ